MKRPRPPRPRQAGPFYEPMNNTQISNLAAGLLDVHGLTGLSMNVSGLTVQDLAGIQPTPGRGREPCLERVPEKRPERRPHRRGRGALRPPRPPVPRCCAIRSPSPHRARRDLRGLLTDLSQRMPVRLQSFTTGQNDQFTLTLSIYMLDPVV